MERRAESAFLRFCDRIREAEFMYAGPGGPAWATGSRPSVCDSSGVMHGASAAELKRDREAALLGAGHTC